jgi:hypothetical protein
MTARLLCATVAAVLLALTATSGPAIAQDTEAEAEPEPSAEEAAPAESPPPAAPSTGVFIPTEKIPADASISFPVDI